MAIDSLLVTSEGKVLEFLLLPKLLSGEDSVGADENELEEAYEAS